MTLETLPRPAMTFATNKAYTELLNGSTRWLGSSAYPVPSSYTTEIPVRGAGMAAWAMATTIQAQLYDPAQNGGLPYTTPNIKINSLITGAVNGHVSNIAGGWGSAATTWQSGLWAFYLGMAYWLNQNYLGSLEAAVERMIIAEADRIAATSPRFMVAADGTVLTPGDTGAEENAWNTLAPALAACMLPNHAHRGSWMNAVCRFALGSFTHQDDLASTEIRNGIPVNTLAGWNLEADYTVTNHNLSPHPDYTSAVSLLGLAALPFFMTGRSAPTSLLWNADRVYGTLSMPLSAYGNQSMYKVGQANPSIFYPQGNDWGTHRAPDCFIACDSAARTMLFDTYSARAPFYYEWVHLMEQLLMQRRGTSGAYYINSTEFVYGAREQLAAADLTQAFWHDYTDAFALVDYTDEPYL